MKKFKLFALAAFAMLSTNAFAANAIWTGSTVISEGGGIIYTPVGSDSKAPLAFTIIAVEDNDGAGTAISKGWVSVSKNAGQMDDYTTITIPAKVTIPVTVTVGGDVKFDDVYEFDVVEVADEGFLNLKKLTSVTLPASITAIGDRAFKGTALSAISFPGVLKEIGDEAFAKGAEKYPEFSEVTIPAAVTTIGASAFEGCENLATVTVENNSWLNSIGYGAFAYTSVQTLNLSTAIKNNNGTPANPNDDGLRGIGAIFTSDAHGTNGMIKTVVLPTTCDAIFGNAFANCVNLTTIDLKDVTTIFENAFDGCVKLASVTIATGTNKSVGTIASNAFANCSKLATVELGKIVDTSIINLKAFGGTGEVVEVAWTAGDKVAATTVIDDAVSEIFGRAGVVLVGEGDPAAVTVAEAEDLATRIDDLIAAGTPKIPHADATEAAAVTTFTFNAIEAALNAAFDLATVRTLNFKNYIKTANLIADATFQHAFPAPTSTAVNTINYNYTDRGTNELVNPFVQTAFKDAPADPNTITMKTTAEFEKYVTVTLATTIYKVTISGNYTTDIIIGYGTDTKKLAKDKNSNYYYYFFKPENNMKIAKINENDAKVTVYQAYIDIFEDEASCLFQPLAVVGGQYVVEGGQTVIVKSDKEDGVKAKDADGAGSTMVYVGGGLKNILESTAEKVSVLEVQTGGAYCDNGNKDLWFFNNPTKSGFGFTKFDAANQKSGLGANTVYMTCPATAAARLNLVWLDEDGEVTAIQKVETKSTDNGAIYNLRGEKVNASYKGLVIKNGKKFIQK